MQAVNFHEVKTKLTRLIEQAVNGEFFIIAKAGKPLVKMTKLAAPSGAGIRRSGVLAGKIAVPDDFDRMGHEEIDLLFGEDA
jgi:antitoxin (DNA-binding transcriptional repressor) of toxin-antitoxin stability system